MKINPRGRPHGKVSVVIVTWNHREYLPKCLEALSGQSYQAIEVIVVDNASQDGSPEYVQEFAPFVDLIQMKSNIGFSAAFNLGVNRTDSEFIISLNPDVTAKTDFVAHMVKAAKQDHKVGIVAPKLFRADDDRYLDSTGIFLNRQRRPYDRGQMQLDQGQFDDNKEIFGACGAAALYKRTMLVDLAFNQEYFDESFFAYYEDADLAWRAKLRGWRCVYSPDAVAYHVRGWGDTLRKSPIHRGDGPRLALRNHLLMILKNDTGPNFLYDAPIILISEISRLGYILIFRREALKGLLDLIQMSHMVKEKRKFIQNRRTVSDGEIRKWFARHD